MIEPHFDGTQAADTLMTSDDRTTRNLLHVALAALMLIGAPACVAEPPVMRVRQLDSTLAVPRYFHTATPLKDGRVLLTCGVMWMQSVPGTRRQVPMTTESTELFDPVKHTFVKGPDMKVGRVMHTATRLPDGRVVVLGGESLGVIEACSPEADKWEQVGLLKRPRLKHDGTLLADGRVLVSGGMTLAVGLGGGRPRVRQKRVEHLEVFDPQTGKTVVLKSTPAISRVGHDAILMKDDTVLLVGGNPSRPEVERLDVKADKLRTIGKLDTARDDASVLVLDDGRVLVAGGNGPGRVTVDTVEVFDPATGKSTTLKDKLSSPASDMSMVRLGRYVVLIGGEINKSRKAPREVTLKDVNLVDLEKLTVRPLGKTKHVRDDSAAWPTGPRSLVVCGGEDDDGRGLTSAEHLEIVFPGQAP